MQSRFHTYSFGNTMLILLQTEGRATRIASFRTWLQLGRHVRKGEKKAFASSPRSRDAALTTSEDTARVAVGFRAVSVFDIAQTDGDPLPEVAGGLQGDDPAGFYFRLVEVAVSIGYSVEDADFDGEKNGDCTFAARGASACAPATLPRSV